MRSLVLVSFALIACGKKTETNGAGSAGPPPAHGEAAIAKMTELRDQACACKDKTCADAVSAAVRKWSADDLKANGALALTEEQGARMAKIAAALGDCVQVAISPTTTKRDESDSVRG